MSPGKKQLNIISDTCKLADVESFLSKVFSDYKLDSQFFNKVLLCVSEAVTNSIMHGNKSDVNKMVKVETFVCLNHLHFRIIDEGEGFNYNELKDPTQPETLKNETGRGIYLIQNICEGIQFKDRGNICEFKIRIRE